VSHGAYIGRGAEREERTAVLSQIWRERIEFDSKCRRRRRAAAL
jgi:hypothetical protein